MNKSKCDSVDHMRACILSKKHKGLHIDSKGDQWGDGTFKNVVGKLLKEDGLIFIKRKKVD